MTKHPTLLCLSTCALLLLSPWAIAQNNPYAPTSHSVPASAPNKGSKMDDLTRFATGGAKVLDSVKGALTDKGGADVILILDPPSSATAKTDDSPGRDVLLLVRDASGVLQKAASNSHVVPCATCGGVAGDPYGFTKIDAGHFTITNGGGSREHWSDEYSFTYAPEKKNWFVTRVVRRVDDTITGKHKSSELTPKELGSVTFSDFDPSTLPEVTLP